MAKDGFIVDEPLFSTAETYISNAITDIENTAKLLNDVATYYPSGFGYTDYIMYACSKIANTFLNISNFQYTMAQTRDNLATLDEAFAEAQKKRKKGFISSLFDECGAAYKNGFSSLLNGEGLRDLIDAFSRTGATFLVTGISVLNSATNMLSSPITLIASGGSHLFLTLVGKEDSFWKDITKRVLRGEIGSNLWDGIYNTKFGERIADKSFINYDSEVIRDFEKSFITRINDVKEYALFGKNHSSAKEIVDNSAKEMSNFNNVFNEHYGGAQGDPAKILKEYGSERRMLNDTSINGQKAQMLYSKIKEYYPDATFDDMKKLAEAYNNCGCSYMALADAFTLHASSQEKGEEIFKKVVGKKLYSSDASTKSANVEVMALDLFLYRNKDKSLEGIINSDINSIASNTDYNNNIYLKKYFKEKNVKVYSETIDVLPDKQSYIKMYNDVYNFEKKHDDGIYTLTAWNFNMISNPSNENVNNSGDAALGNNNTPDKKYIDNVGGHAMFVTGYRDDVIEVSSWAGKYDIPISSSFGNRPIEGSDVNYMPKMYMVGYDFDYSDVLD